MPPQPKHVLRPEVETLETRLVPARVFLQRGVLFIDAPVSVASRANIYYTDAVNNTTRAELFYWRSNRWQLAERRNFASGAITAIRFDGSNGNDLLYNRTAKFCRAYGYGGNDRMFGGSSRDDLHGGPGADRLFGNQGNDLLYGGPGNDIMDGGPGGDGLSGDGGNDLLVGGVGTDVLLGKAGDDILVGGRLDLNTLFIRQDQQEDLLIGGADADTYVADWYWTGTRWANYDDPGSELKLWEGDKIDNPR